MRRITAIAFIILAMQTTLIGMRCLLEFKGDVWRKGGKKFGWLRNLEWEKNRIYRIYRSLISAILKIYINTSLSNRDPSRRKKRCLLCAHGISLLTWRVLSFSLLRGVRDGHRDYRITGSRWAPFAFFSANIREPPPLHGWNIDETRRRLPLSPLHNFLALCSIKNSLYPSISELPIFPYILLIIGTKYGNSMAQRTKSLVRWEDKGNSR